MNTPLPIQTRCKILQQKYADFLQHSCNLSVEVVVSRSDYRGLFLSIAGTEAQVEQAFEELSIEPTEKMPALFDDEPNTVVYFYNVSA